MLSIKVSPEFVRLDDNRRIREILGIEVVFCVWHWKHWFSMETSRFSHYRVADSKMTGFRLRTKKRALNVYERLSFSLKMNS